MRQKQDKICVAYLTTYPPRECGIASFSADLINYSEELFGDQVENKVVAMNLSRDLRPEYSSEVILEIYENDPAEYIAAARKLNLMSEIKAVLVQHEFGIFGLNYGENLIFFLSELERPAIVTFHTVLPHPPAGMIVVMEKIIARAEKIVVMTELSKKLLTDIYRISEDKIKIIPHGIHPEPYSDTKAAKKELKMEGKRILSTFGLLGRGKGIEFAIRAMPDIVKKYPDAVYLVLGATHPVVLKNEGEEYRRELMALADSLNVGANVMFINRYLSKKELLLYLKATDIYLALSQNPDQTVSGTLTYALGGGRAVISTPFMQAKELVTSEVGALVSFSGHASIAKEALRFLGDPETLLNMGKSAYFRTRNMTWPNVALSYMGAVSGLLPVRSQKNKYMLPINLDHIKKLTDDFGIFQFASWNDPDPKWGYTLDDNARALVALSWCYNLYPSQDIADLIKIYLNFIERASNSSGGFFNYFNKEKNPSELTESENLEDANARALWALAVAGQSKALPDIQERARQLFQKDFLSHEKFSSPRAAAIYIKALAENISGIDDASEAKVRIKKYADFLVDLFLRTNNGQWQWFEDILSYSNAVLPEALLVAYSVLQDPVYLSTARKSLDFLANQSFYNGVCAPVGQSGWFKKGEQKQIYDQQPEEVGTLVLALGRMFIISGDDSYRKKMFEAFDWFLGNNISKQMVYTHSTGGSYDGVRKEGVNLNQGAESTISYLLARLFMEKVKISSRA